MKPAARQAPSDAIAAGLVLAAGSVLAAAGRVIASSRSPSDAESLLGICASAVGLIIVAWWLLAMTFAVLAALLQAGGRQRAARWAAAPAPPFMRRLTLAVLGATLAVGPAAYAEEQPPDPTWQAAAPLAAASVPREAASSPGAPSASAVREQDPQPEAWTPRPVPTSSGPLTRPELRATATPSSAVEVRPGDSLWSIVARHLGPRADAVDVAEMWPLWFEANRSVMGDDPNFLRPGQLLLPPKP